MQPVETKYAWLGRDRIAYQVFGQGPPDLVVTFGSFGHVDVAWEDPGIALFLRTLASFSRLILFDRRGTGASDPVLLDALPPWEMYAEELDAVLDEVGSERVAIMAHVDAGAMAMLFAATRPERTSALVLVNTSAKWVAADDYPVGIPLRSRRRSWRRLTSCGAPRPWSGCGQPAGPATNASAAGRPSTSAAWPVPGPFRRSTV